MSEKPRMMMTCIKMSICFNLGKVKCTKLIDEYHLGELSSYVLIRFQGSFDFRVSTLL
jgi:hypothetical protein